MSPGLVKTIGSAVVAVLGAFVVSNPFPAVPAIAYASLASLLVGWLHLPQPK